MTTLADGANDTITELEVFVLDDIPELESSLEKVFSIYKGVPEMSDVLSNMHKLTSSIAFD